MLLRPTPPGGQPGEALIEYMSAEFRVVRTGAFVRCAVTGERIPLEELRYWSVERQEPYADAAAAIKRRRQLEGRS